jgi:hypothetical protein
MRILSLKKFNKHFILKQWLMQGWGVAQRYSVCLTCMRDCVQSSAPQKAKHIPETVVDFQKNYKVNTEFQYISD